MNVRYLDRGGRTLSKEKWEALLRDPEYCTVKVSEIAGSRRLVTSWLGVVAECEREPRTFLVQGQRLVCAGKKEEWEQIYLTWHRTEADAIWDHNRVAEAAGK